MLSLFSRHWRRPAPDARLRADLDLPTLDSAQQARHRRWTPPCYWMR